jgi:hypothetical protein
MRDGYAALAASLPELDGIRLASPATRAVRPCVLHWDALEPVPGRLTST